MTNDEINIVIAEEYGWKFVLGCWNAPNRSCLRIVRACSDGDEKTYPPYYFKDLNAMHEVEASLFGRNDWSACKYERLLTRMTSSWAWHATAAQRAEAFVKTIGKWKE